MVTYRRYEPPVSTGLVYNVASGGRNKYMIHKDGCRYAGPYCMSIDNYPTGADALLLMARTTNTAKTCGHCRPDIRR